MRHVDRSALVPYAAEQMFALVADIERYPDFLPWCTGAELVSRTDAEQIGTLAVGIRGLDASFTTRNTLDPPESMTLELQDGPFRELAGEWRFVGLDSAAQPGCEVSLAIRFEFASRVQDALLGPGFETVCNQLIDAFIERARVVYGQAHD